MVIARGKFLLIPSGSPAKGELSNIITKEMLEEWDEGYIDIYNLQDVTSVLTNYYSTVLDDPTCHSGTTLIWETVPFQEAFSE